MHSTRARSFLWLIALAAFVCPPLTGAVASSAVDHMAVAMPDCPDHVPPPDPCPLKDTAKHAAGDCCPMMSGVPALLPEAIPGDTRSPFHSRVLSVGISLTGLLFTQDPPPPRA